MNIIDNPIVIEQRNKLSNIDQLMQRGICEEPVTKKLFFTGYEDKILFDWDQYFESIIQIYMGWKSEYIKNGVLLFLENQHDNGFITRSVPVLPPNDNEHVKPFLAQIINLVKFVYNDNNWITETHYEKLKKYIKYWLNDMDSNNNGLCEWMSSLHTGMDNQHERAGYWNERFCEGVDLNSYMYLELLAMAEIAKSFNKQDDTDYYLKHADKIKTMIQLTMWNDEEGIYYDIDTRSGKQIKVKSISCFMPLWAKIASPEQAERMILEHLFNPAEFYSAYPFSAYAKTEKGYRTEHVDTDIGCNWRAHTWISTNYMMYHALRYYGYKEKASSIAIKTRELVEKAGNWEYYNTETGEGIKQNPFWGWSLLGYFMEMEDKLDTDITLLHTIY